MTFKDLHFFKRTFLITILIVVTVILNFDGNELLNFTTTTVKIYSNESYSSMILTILKNKNYSIKKNNNSDNFFLNESITDCPLIPNNLSKFYLKKKQHVFN